MFIAVLISCYSAYKATTVLIKKYDQSHLINKLLFCCVGLLVSTVAPIVVFTLINVIYPLEGDFFLKIFGQALWIGIIVPIIVSWKKPKANSLYHNKIKTKIAVAQLTFKDDSSLLEYLNRKGGVHKWVVWVFGGIPIIGIVAAFVLPMVAHKKYTSPTDTLSVVPTCFATWNGRYFVRGKPQDEDNFLSIRFPMTVDSVFVPLHMNWTQKMLREQLVDIQKICPNIELPVENSQIVLNQSSYEKEIGTGKGLTLNHFRENYPQYADLSDIELSSALKKKYYEKVSEKELEAKLGYVFK